MQDAVLSCGVCMELFEVSLDDRSPKMLACGHTYCLQCVRQLSGHGGGSITCPACREVTRVPPGGPTELQNNYSVLGMMDLVAQHREPASPVAAVCDNCDRNGPASPPMRRVRPLAVHRLRCRSRMRSARTPSHGAGTDTRRADVRRV